MINPTDANLFLEVQTILGSAIAGVELTKIENFFNLGVYGNISGTLPEKSLIPSPCNRNSEVLAFFILKKLKSFGEISGTTAADGVKKSVFRSKGGEALVQQEVENFESGTQNKSDYDDALQNCMDANQESTGVGSFGGGVKISGGSCW